MEILKFIHNMNYIGVRLIPIGPRSCYDEGKRCAETLFFDYHRQHNVNIKIARIFNTYGPRMHPDDGRVVSNFIVQALLDKDITIYGDGTQTRSFCYIDDLIGAMQLFMNSGDDFTGPINIGNPDEFSILELAEKVIDLTNSKSKLVFKELPEDDPKQRQPDIMLAKENLNWEPKIKLNDGLKHTIEYFKRFYKKKMEGFILNQEKSWILTDRQLCDCEMIMDGSFSPLDHFMTESDYESVLTDMRLSNGDLFPLPIVLDVNKEFSDSIKYR